MSKKSLCIFVIFSFNWFISFAFPYIQKLLLSVIFISLSKDKLVIIVTHNYEQVEPYVTRKIKMHDGRVLEDKKIKDVKIEKITSISTYKNITLSNKIRLGVRNAFNIVPKFLLILFVYLFMTLSLVSEYASSKKQAYIASKSGWTDTEDVFRSS